MSRKQQELPASRWVQLKVQLEARRDDLKRMAELGGMGEHWQAILEDNDVKILELEALIDSGGEEEQRPEWLTELEGKAKPGDGAGGKAVKSSAKGAKKRGPQSRKGVAGSPVRNRFAGLLRHYLELIRKKYDRTSGYDLLADAAGISQPLLYAWTSRLDRLPSRENIASLAWAIVTLMDGYVPDRKGFLLDPQRRFVAADGQLTYRQRLPIVLNELLRARGFATVGGLDHNVAWARIVHETEAVVERKDELAWSGFNPAPSQAIADAGTVGLPKLRVGWVVNAPILKTIEKGGEPIGFIREITDQVAAWLGLKADWAPRPMNWDEVPSSLLVNAEVDILAPMVLLAPYRMFTCQLSKPLPALLSGMNAIITAEGKQTFSARAVGGSRVANIDMLHFEYIPGNIGQWGASLLGPAVFGAKIPDDQLTEYASAVDNNNLPEQVAMNLLDEPMRQDKYRCVITGQLHCYQAEQLGNAGIASLLDLHESVCKVPYGFIVSWREPQLLSAVNCALDRLVESGVYYRILEKYADDIGETGIADFAKVEEELEKIRALERAYRPRGQREAATGTAKSKRHPSGD